MKRRHVLIGAGSLALAGVGATALSLQQMGSMEAYDATAAVARAGLSERPELRDLIRFATLAASGHNTQPWQFRAAENRIDILPDLSRRTPVVDPDDYRGGCARPPRRIAV
jgi:hypothetical protein